MNQPLGIDDFFVIEASEYLDRLAVLVGGTSAPNPDELVRFTRALRGSALMANQQPIARATGGMEQLVRAYRDGRRPWDAELGGLVREAVDTIRTLVERTRTWTPEDSSRAERLAVQLEGSAGIPARPATAAPLVSDAGVRAFLAREAASLGSVLDQAGRSLLSGPVAPETIQAVLRRMQPIRGLAALTDFPPLPDVLDGIERTAVAASRLELSAPRSAGRLSAAARALARAARDIADRGRPDPDADEFRALAKLLLSEEPEEVESVPIESLFFDGENGIVQRGTAPRAAPGGLGAAAVVSRGEHLCQTADEIAEATSATQRDLRLHLLASDLRTLGSGLPSGLDRAVASFAAAARAVVVRGAAAANASRFAKLIRDAGARLRAFTEVTQPATLIQAFAALEREAERLGAAPVAAVAPATPAAAPVEEEAGVVPIESLAPDEAVAVAPGPAPAAAEDGWDLAASYARFEALIGIAIQPPAEPEAAPAPIPVAAAAAAAPPEPERPVVDIADLCYRGRAALERADLVRREIRFALSTEQPVGAIRPLVDELLDLVELALVD